MQKFTNDITWTMNNATGLLNDDITNVTSGKSEESYIGMFSRLQYDYKGRYYLTGTVRRDGSSKFGPDNRWGLFPSGSIAWRISDESFMKGIKSISDMKFRLSYGVTGNSNFNSRYISQALLASQQYVLNGDELAFGYREANIANPGLKWEQTSEIDLGMDAVLFKDRMEATFDIFKRKTRDLIWTDQVPSIMGKTSILRNVGSVENQGAEFSLNGRILTGLFKWNLGGNITFYRNKVTALGIKDEQIVGNNIIKVGHPLGLIYTGLNDGSQYHDFEESASIPWMKSKKTGYTNFPFPGSTKIIDVNRSGLVDADDRTIVGCAQPDFYFGINTNFSYKNFELKIDMNGAVGMEVLNTVISDRILLGNNSGRNNVPKWYYDNLWTYDNPEGKFPLLARKNENASIQGYTYSKYGSYFVFDASYLNISSITLAYNVPHNYMNYVGLKSAKLYLNVSNAYIFTNYYAGYNPEYNAQGDDSIQQGIDNGAYPMSRTIKLGINIEL
jgi:TonB-linked SusC/RagA family outer membrane protein